MLNAKPGEIIRHKGTRESFLVIGKSPQGLYVVSLLQRIDPAPMQIILARASDNFEPDFKMVDLTQEEAAILKTKLPIVEAIQQSLLDKEGK